MYYRLTFRFVNVTVTNHNVNLHQSLGVPPLLYSHVYYPQVGLVEELGISKKYFPNLVQYVCWYTAVHEDLPSKTWA